MTIDAAKIEDGLIASSDLAGELNHPGQDIKPCIAAMLENSYCRGDTPDRNTAALIIACELKRIGLNESEVEYRIQEWNQRNRPPLRLSEYRKAVKSAFSDRYNYGCYNHHFENTCIGRDNCPFFNHVLSQRKTYNNRIFFRYRWPEILSNSAKDIYFLALVELERLKRVGPGGRIYSSHRQIAKLAGLSRRIIKKGLEELHSIGLIDYRPGLQHIWRNKASEIRRILPIPKPSPELMTRLEKGEK